MELLCDAGGDIEVDRSAGGLGVVVEAVDDVGGGPAVVPHLGDDAEEGEGSEDEAAGGVIEEGPLVFSGSLRVNSFQEVVEVGGSSTQVAPALRVSQPREVGEGVADDLGFCAVVGEQELGRVVVAEEVGQERGGVRVRQEGGPVRGHVGGVVSVARDDASNVATDRRRAAVGGGVRGTIGVLDGDGGR